MIYIACTIESKYVQHFVVMMNSLFINNYKNKFKVFLVIDKISLFSRCIIHYTFIKYGQEVEIILFRKFKSIYNFPLSAHASYANYYRLFLSELLPVEITKVLYLDCDLIVLDDILPIWNINLENNFAAVCYPLIINSYNYPTRNIEFNSGVMLINLEVWRNSNVIEKFINYIHNNMPNIRFWDQDVLNGVIGSSITTFDDRYNCTLKTLNRINAINPVIIHFIGTHKPWHYYCDHEMKYVYHEYRKYTLLRPIVFKERTFYYRIKEYLYRFIISRQKIIF
ncbi:MAG: glycosyltransferase family 8 protein [Cyclobacteriaceae bacterium]|nr:glycosyltransferase family 8 protein [Cyclobacteriaceae bacterium]